MWLHSHIHHPSRTNYASNLTLTHLLLSWLLHLTWKQHTERKGQNKNYGGFQFTQQTLFSTTIPPPPFFGGVVFFFRFYRSWIHNSKLLHSTTTITTRKKVLYLPTLFSHPETLNQPILYFGPVQIYLQTVPSNLQTPPCPWQQISGMLFHSQQKTW